MSDTTPGNDARTRTRLTMRTSTLAIIAAPLACWAVLGGAAQMGMDERVAVAAAVLWGALWLTIAHAGRGLYSASRRSSRGRGGDGTTRSIWRATVLSSMLAPIPVYLLSVLFDRLAIAPASVTLPMFAMLALPVPASLWWTVLCPAADLDEESIAPIGWHRYTPCAPLAVIPPRGSMR